VLRSEVLSPQPAGCPAWIANPGPAPADLSATGFTPAQVSAILNVSLSAVLELSRITTPAVAQGCYACTPQHVAEGRYVATVTNASLYYATTLAVGKQGFPACFGPGGTTAAPETTTTTTTTVAPATTTTATSTTAAPATTAAPTGNATTDAPTAMSTTTTAAGLPTTAPVPTGTSTGPAESTTTVVAPPPSTNAGNHTEHPTTPVAPPPSTVEASTMAPTQPAPEGTTAAPAPTFVPPVTTFPPTEIIRFTFEADPPAPGEPFDMAAFKTKMARFFSVNESDISPVQTGTTADGKAIVSLVFKGSDRSVLQNQMASLTTEQEQALGITKPQASAINPPTPAPPSNDLKRSGSTIWIYGAAVLGGMLLIGGVVFFIRSRKSGIASAEDMDTPMLQVPRSDNAV